jgi:hypothetical protein
MRTPSNLSTLVMQSIAVTFALLSLVMFCGPVRAATITGLCNTGWNAPCTAELPGPVLASPVAPNELDPNYFLSANPNNPSAIPGNAIVVNTNTDPIFPLGHWLADTNVSHWIGPVADERFGLGCCAPPPFIFPLAPYIYQDAFSFLGSGSATINGQWAADNEAEIFVDGNLATGATISDNGTTAFDSWHLFSISLSGLNPGNHTLDFQVTNFSNATGLRVEYFNAVPEPSTVTLLGAGLLALGFVILRRRIEVVQTVR